MAGIRLEFAQFGHFDSFDVIRSLTSMAGVADVDLPTPIATDLKIMYYVDVNIVKGVTYYYKVRVWRGTTSFLSDEMACLAGILWNPTNLTNQAKLQFNADNVVVDGANRISQLSNIASNNYHFTQSTNTNKAIKQFDSAINHSVMQFDGVDDYYTSQAANALSANVNKLWSFAVHKRNTTTATTSCLVGFTIGTGGNAGTGRFRHYASTTLYANNVGLGVRRLDTESSFTTLYQTEGTSTDWVISLAYRDYSTAKSIVSVNANNYESTAGTVGNTPNTSDSGRLAWIGSEIATTGFMSGSIAELLVGNTALTQDDIDRLFGWAAHKYGLSDRLPIDHPYKNLMPMQD